MSTQQFDLFSIEGYIILSLKKEKSLFGASARHLFYDAREGFTQDSIEAACTALEEQGVLVSKEEQTVSGGGKGKFWKLRSGVELGGQVEVTIL